MFFLDALPSLFIMATSERLKLTHRCGPSLPARPSFRPLPNNKRFVKTSALPLELLHGDVASMATQLLHHLPLAYEPVAAPCSLMNCGDAIYRRCAILQPDANHLGTAATTSMCAARAVQVDDVASHTMCSMPLAQPPFFRALDTAENSTLDPVLRKEVGGPSWQVFALLAAAGVYLFATPGESPHNRLRLLHPWPAFTDAKTQMHACGIHTHATFRMHMHGTHVHLRPSQLQGRGVPLQSRRLQLTLPGWLAGILLMQYCSLLPAASSTRHESVAACCWLAPGVSTEILPAGMPLPVRTNEWLTHSACQKPPLIVKQ